MTVRIASYPKHGTITAEVSKSFPGYAAGNVRSKCNTQEVEGIDIWYQADAGFQGSDTAAIEVIASTGQYAEVKFLIDVRGTGDVEVGGIIQTQDRTLPTVKGASTPEKTWSVEIAEGQQRILAGDILGARKALSKPAEANNAEALLLLAETYDPKMLALWRASGSADIRLARALYSRALSNGLELARVRLKALSQEEPAE